MKHEMEQWNNGGNNKNQTNLPSAIKPWLDLMLDLHPIQSETM
jgi:hypothetical protein